MRRVLITGITGFAGSHLAERLVESGDEVHGIANETPPFPNLSRVSREVTVHSADVLDPDAVRAAFERARPEIVFHLAGQAVPTLATADPLAAVRVNVLGTAHVAVAVHDMENVHLVAASSADVYGIPDAVPSNEDVRLHPTNVYAATKVAAEAILRASAGSARVTILRPCNQIGPRLHPRLVASEFAKRIAEAEAGLADPVVRHGQLEPRREFLDVRDMAAAYEKAAGIDEDEATYNVGTGTAVSVAEILEVIVGLARIPIRAELDPDRVRPGVPPVLLLDSSRFRERTGWRPEIPLERSLGDTLDYWREEVTKTTRAGAEVRT